MLEEHSLTSGLYLGRLDSCRRNVTGAYRASFSSIDRILLSQSDELDPMELILTSYLPASDSAILDMVNDVPLLVMITLSSEVSSVPLWYHTRELIY